MVKIATLCGCANIVPPQGGPRDSIPPHLVKATPGDSTRNFTGNRIVLTFDEFIDVQNLNEQLLVSPTPNNYPSVDFRLNTLTVKWKDTLEANTTYAINFGEAIKDYTEGNPLRNFTYTFSTGQFIDSLQLSGSVVLAETGKLDTTLIVMLHTNPNDSAVVRDRPRYIAKLDSKGNFTFKNLPPRTFYLYALKDEGGTKRYFRDNQLFAFADKPVIVDGNNEAITLFAYAAKPTPVQTAIPNLNVGGRRRAEGTTESRLRHTNNLVTGQQDLQSDFILSFEQPLRKFTAGFYRLYYDSTYIEDSSYALSQDSTRKKVILKNDWKENTLYHVVLNKEFAEDSLGRKLLKTDTINFTTKKLSDYGSLKLKFRGLDLAKNPVLQLVLNDNIIKMVPLSGTEFAQALFLPGEYELRILFDDNKNGVWDPGEFFNKHKQPEIVKPIERRVVVKSNFANEYEIQL